MINDGIKLNPGLPENFDFGLIILLVRQKKTKRR